MRSETRATAATTDAGHEFDDDADTRGSTTRNRCRPACVIQFHPVGWCRLNFCTNDANGQSGKGSGAVGAGGLFDH